MYGAIVGDIVGSRFEFNNHKSKEFELFTEECKVTDDSIMTLAVGKAIMEYTGFWGYCSGMGAVDGSLGELAVKNMRELGQKYPECGYGQRFYKWMFSQNPKPYNSYGNGAAMRVSAAGYFALTEEQAVEYSHAVTEVTHNHPEGLKGAEAVAVAIFLARNWALKREIKQRMSEYYDINFRLDDIRENYRHDESCRGSVPQAIVAFLEGDSFEDVIRTAVSIGGDSDTIAAIAGSIAAAYYRVPGKIWGKAESFLDKELQDILFKWSHFIFRHNKRLAANDFLCLTKYIRWIEQGESFGEPGKYSEFALSFMKDFNAILLSYPGYNFKNYQDILTDEEINMWNLNNDETCRDEESMGTVYGAFALIMQAIKREEFIEGSLLDAYERGHILKALKRLRESDIGHECLFR